jgi:hypothetical protein
MAFNVIRKEKAKEKEKQKKRFLHLLYRYLILILETRTKRTWSVYRREAIGNWKTKEEKADRSLVILFSFFFFFLKRVYIWFTCPFTVFVLLCSVSLLFLPFLSDLRWTPSV